MKANTLVSIAIFLAVVVTLLVRRGFEASSDKIFALAISLLLLLFYRKIAEFSKFGWMASLASDYESDNPAWPYAVILWGLFLLFCGFALFA